MPGTNGPKFSFESGSSEKETAASDLPWKLPVAPTTIALFLGIPFTS